MSIAAHAAGEGGPPQAVLRALPSSPATKGGGANALRKRKAMSGRDTGPFARRARERSPSAPPSTTSGLSSEPESDPKSGSSDSSSRQVAQEIEGHIDIKADKLVAAKTKATGVEDVGYAYHEDIGSLFCCVGAAVEPEMPKVGVDATTYFEPPGSLGERVSSPRSPVRAEPAQEGDQGGFSSVLPEYAIPHTLHTEAIEMTRLLVTQQVQRYMENLVPNNPQKFLEVLGKKLTTIVTLQYQATAMSNVLYDKVPGMIQEMLAAMAQRCPEEDPEVLKRALREAQESQKETEVKLKKVETELERSQRRANDLRDDLARAYGMINTARANYDANN